MTEARVLADLLPRAAQSPHGVRYLQGGGRESRLTYADLLQRARGLLGLWQQRGVRPGERVLLFVRDNRALVDAFWACQLGGLVPVPLSAGLQAGARAKLAAVAAAIQPAWLFSERELYLRCKTENNLHDFAERVLLVEDLPAAALTPGDLHPAAPDDLALIQFSSGSTRAPRGVQLSHANLLANVRAIVRAAAIDERDATFSWMPLSHDMGLIGFHLVPLSLGLEQVLMDSELFIRRPALWLRRAGELGASLLCAPNFGFQHYLQRVGEEETALDLSRVRLLFCGAEPVSAAVCREFVQRLAARGLRAEALFPVYGLAEASLAVSFPPPGRGVQSLRVDAGRLATGDDVRVGEGAARQVELVALGTAVDSCELRIADDHGRALAPQQVGHVQIRGASVTRGYFNDREATDEAFVDGWLDSGDLGFISDQGLVICGRAKDVLFAAGQNLYPQDLEHLLTEAGCAQPGKVAVSAWRSDDNAEDRLLVCLQHRGGLREFATRAAAVQTALATAAGVQAHAVIPLARLPRTSSGKLQRYALAEAFARGDYAALLHELEQTCAGSDGAEPQSATARQLLQLCREHFPGQAITPERNLFELGADSLTLVSLHEDIERSFPGKVAITDLFEYPTVGGLAGYIES